MNISHRRIRTKTMAQDNSIIHLKSPQIKKYNDDICEILYNNITLFNHQLIIIIRGYFEENPIRFVSFEKIKEDEIRHTSINNYEDSNKKIRIFFGNYSNVLSVYFNNQLIRDVIHINIRKNIGEHISSIAEMIPDEFIKTNLHRLFDTKDNKNNDDLYQKFYQYGDVNSLYRTCVCGFKYYICACHMCRCKGRISGHSSLCHKMAPSDGLNSSCDDLNSLLSKFIDPDNVMFSGCITQIRKGRDISLSIGRNHDEIIKSFPDNYFFISRIRQSLYNNFFKVVLIKLTDHEYESIINELKEINSLFNTKI
jgi:hypothetical protein